jgi:phosphoesterase RecJ-like protein
MKSNSNCTFSEIGAVLVERSRFLVLSHIRPDGDAIGCSLAMTLCLKAMGKDVTVWNEDGLPERFHFLPESKLIVRPPKLPVSFDVVLVLDTAVRNRAGENCLGAVAPGALWINIDHHISNDRKGDLVYVDAEAPAAAQVLFELFQHCSLPVSGAMAQALYTGISTDTGSFQYSSTTARTYEIAAQLVRCGVAPGEINTQLYQTNPRRRLELKRELLNLLRFSAEDRVASFALSAETVRRLGTIPDDTEGLIDTLREIEGVVVAAFFEELEGGMIRISLRSKDPLVNVCTVCAEYGGGGHMMAAGARIPGELAAVQENVLASIARHLPVGAAH